MDQQRPGQDLSPPLGGEKSQWRRWSRQRRSGESAVNAPEAALGFAQRFVTDPDVDRALASRPDAPVLAYVNTPGEPPTEALRAKLRAAGTAVLLPWACPGRELRWLADSASARAWGLPGIGAPPPTAATLSTAEVLDLDPVIVVVPALAATPEGLRLGQGGGYYDTLLANCPRQSEGGPLRVALVWRWEVVSDLPVATHDETVDVVIGG